MEGEKIMNKEVVSIPTKVRKIVRKKPMNGPYLLEFHLSILSINTKNSIKEHAVPYPSLICTVNHLIPTQDGFKEAGKFKVGDTINTELTLATKS